MDRLSAAVWRVFILLHVAVGWSPVVLAAEVFKYMDDDGVTVLDDHVPPNFVKNGYTVLDATGRVVRIVPRSLTDEEIAERDRRLAIEERIRNEAAEREAADEALLRLYSGPNDVKRARDTKVASVEKSANTARIDLHRVQDQKRQLEARIADIERADGTIPQQHLDRIATLDETIQQLEAEIDAKEAEKDQLMLDYAAVLTRVLELYNLAEESS